MKLLKVVTPSEVSMESTRYCSHDISFPLIYHPFDCSIIQSSYFVPCFCLMCLCVWECFESQVLWILCGMFLIALWTWKLFRKIKTNTFCCFVAQGYEQVSCFCFSFFVFKNDCWLVCLLSLSSFLTIAYAYLCSVSCISRMLSFDIFCRVLLFFVVHWMLLHHGVKCVLCVCCVWWLSLLLISAPI